LKNKTKYQKYFLLLIILLATLQFVIAQPDGDELPRSGFRNEFTPEQDSAYMEALRLKLPLDVQMRNFITQSDKNWQNFIRLQRNSPYGKVLDNLKDIPKEFFIPSGNEQLAYQENIERSLAVPYMNTLPRYGLKIPMSLIGSLLGLTEDVGPNIKYSIEYSDEIEVVVYSIQAKVINTLFKGKQNPGNYNLYWGGRDDNGKLMPQGDYIAEVRIGNNKYIRKRIQIR